MRLAKALGACVATVMAAIMLTACNGTDSSSDDQKPTGPTAASTSRTAPTAPSKTATPSIAPSPSTMPTGMPSDIDADPHRINLNVCDKLTAQRVGELIHETVTSSDVNDAGQRTPNLCIYKFGDDLQISIGVEGDARTEMPKFRKATGAKFTHEFGDETVYLYGNYGIRKGDTFIAVDGVASGLSHSAFLPVVREAVDVL